MKVKIETLFHIVDKCKEDGHKCSLDKMDINFIFKPDKGIKDKTILNKLFINCPQPKLSDCVVIYNTDKVGIIEIKCGKVTKRLIDDTVEKIKNVYTILKEKDILPDKLVLIYKSFDNVKLRQYLQSKKVFNQLIIEKKFSNKAIKIK